MKFEWYRKHEPAKMQAAKELFLREVNSYFRCLSAIAYTFISYGHTALRLSTHLLGPKQHGRMPRGLMTSSAWG
jgi:hypothetical protein